MQCAGRTQSGAQTLASTWQSFFCDREQCHGALERSADDSLVFVFLIVFVHIV